MYLGTVAVYTTLFTEKRDDLFQHFVLGDAQQGTALPILLDQTNRDQRGNVVAQGRCGNGELLLQLSDRQTLLSRLDQMLENEQPSRMTQLFQCLGNFFQLHSSLSLMEHISIIPEIS